MRVRAAIDGHDVSAIALVESATIHQDSSQAISTCDLSLFQRFGISRYDIAEYSQAAFVYQWTVEEWQQIVLWDEDPNQILFGGFVLSVQRRADGPHVRYELGCSDWGILFERALITGGWPAGTPDSILVSDALNLVPELSAGVLDGASGLVRADAFAVTGTSSFTGQVPAGRAINVASGLITGYV